MTPIVWSPEAERDLQGIRDYIAHDSQRYAELVVRRIIAGVERLSTFPESGRVVPELGIPAIREVIIDVFRVVYRYRGEPRRDRNRLSRLPRVSAGPRLISSSGFARAPLLHPETRKAPERFRRLCA